MCYTVRPASCGGARRSRGSRKHRGQTTQGLSLWCHGQISQKDRRPCRPSSGKQTGSQCSVHPEAHALPRGRKGKGKGEDGVGLSQKEEETQVASASELAHQLASQQGPRCKLVVLILCSLLVTDQGSATVNLHTGPTDDPMLRQPVQRGLPVPPQHLNDSSWAAPPLRGQGCNQIPGPGLLKDNMQHTTLEGWTQGPPNPKPRNAPAPNGRPRQSPDQTQADALALWIKQFGATRLSPCSGPGTLTRGLPVWMGEKGNNRLPQAQTEGTRL